MTKEDSTTALSNWRSLRKALKTATEEDLARLLDEEKQGQARPTFVARIYGRYSVVKGERERRESLGAKT